MADITALIGADSRVERLSGAFNPNRNGLNAIRLFLATAVIFSHAGVFGGYDVPRSVGVLLGECAVDGFFGISGFLLARSWLRNPEWRAFLWRRCLRILPAFWVCLAVTAFGVTPVAFALSGQQTPSDWLNPGGPVSYISSNWLLRIGQSDVWGQPTGVPFPGNWNPSLWTLYWEFLCYLGLMMLGALGLLRRRKVVLGLWLLLWVLVVLGSALPIAPGAFAPGEWLQVGLRLAFMFVTGVALWLFGDRVPLSARLVTFALVLFTASVFLLLDYRPIGGIALVYVILWIAVKAPLRLGSKNDLSYGVYVYAGPGQQLLAMSGLASTGWLVFSLLGAAAAFVAAALSWFIIERPALRLKSWRPSTRRRDGFPGPTSSRIPSQPPPKKTALPVAVTVASTQSGVFASLCVTTIFLLYLILGWLW